MMRVLWLSDGPSLFTGFAKVSREILRRLAATGDFECTWGASFEGQAVEQWEGLPVRVYPGGRDYGCSCLEAMLDAAQPDVVVAAGDLWMIQWMDALGQHLNVPLVGYCPLDGAPISARWHGLIGMMERLVVPSQFAGDLVSAELPGTDCVVVPYGVDTDVFLPYGERERFRSQFEFGFGGARVPLTNQVVIGCVARNQPRKQIPILIEAFGRLAKIHDDARLILHTAPLDLGWDIADLLQRHRVASRTAVTGGGSPYEGLSDRQMADLYNLLDVFVLPTMGEGFGLPILEAMACGVPVVATDCSAVTELVRGRGELIRVKERLTVGPYNVEQALADGEHLVDLLSHLHENAEVREEYGRKGRAFAETMTWDRCAEQWAKLLEEVAAERPVAARPVRIVNQEAADAAAALEALAEGVGEAELRPLAAATAVAGLRTAAEIARQEGFRAGGAGHDDAIEAVEGALQALHQAGGLRAVVEPRREETARALQWLDGVAPALAQRYGFADLHPSWKPPVSSITMCAPFMVYDGYGSIAEYVAVGMARAGAKVNLDPVYLDLNAMLPEFHELWKNSQPEEGAPVLFFSWPVPKLDTYVERENLVINTMWESSCLPRDWPAKLNRARALIVPTPFVARVCRDSGVTAPIEVIREGIDPDLYHYEARPQRAGVTTLIVGTMVDRKHTREGVTAWKRAFEGDPDARLVIKARFHYGNYAPDDPRIRFVDCEETTRGIAHWYREADVLLALGNEGFGLPLVEAMATGLPCIALDSEGQSDTFAEAREWLLRVEPVGWQTSYQREFGRCGVRAVPDVEQVVKHLRWVAAHREEARAMGRAAAQWARENRNVWKKAPALLDVMEQYTQPSRPLRRAPAFWVPSWRATCGLAEYTGHLAEHLPGVRVSAGPPDPRGVRVLHIQHEASLFEDAPLQRQIRQARRRGVPVAVTEHSVLPVGRPWENDADVLVSLTEHGAAMLRERCPGKRVEHILHGCPTWFPRRKMSRGRTIGAFGFLEPYKGFWKLLDVLREVPDTELLLFSHAKSPVRDVEWNEAARGLPVRRVSGFLSPEEIARRLAAEADILVFWYDEPPFAAASGAVRVGLATGVPVLTSPVSWFADLREVTYQRQDLIEGVRHLLDDTPLRDQITTAAREFCHRHSWESTAQRHEELWRAMEADSRLAPALRT